MHTAPKPFSPTRALGALSIILSIVGSASAQLSITTTNSATVINFDSYVANVFGTSTYQAPTGSNFAPTTTASAPYDSDAWAALVAGGANGVLPSDASGSTASVGFGGTSALGNVARGQSATASGTAGLQLATGLSTGNGLAFRPQGTGTDNATVWLKIQNNTGGIVNQWTLGYAAYFIDVGTGTSVSLSYSTDGGGTYSSNVGNLSFTTAGTNTAPTTPTAADWQAVTSISSTTIDAEVAASGYLLLRWQFGPDITTNSAYGNRVALDNISVTASAVPEPSTYAALAGLGALGLAALRRRR